MAKYKYEVLWYTDPDTYETKEFSSRKAAMNYYEKHKDDDGKFGWWVTKRDEDWFVVEDLVY